MSTGTGEMADGNNTQMSVTIKQLDGTTFNVQIPANATVGELKQSIQRDRDVPPERQRLIYRAQELKNDGTWLAAYGVVDQSTLHIVIRPLGSVPGNQSRPDVAIDVPQNQYDGNPYMYGMADGEGAPAQVHDNAPPQSVFHIVKLCRFVRIFAIMDFIFLVLFGLTLSFLFFIMAALALAGYYGAKILKRSYLAAYMVCLVLEIGTRGYLIYLDGKNTISVILFILMIFIDLFVLRCVIQLYKAIPCLNAEQRDHVMVLNRVGLF